MAAARAVGLARRHEQKWRHIMAEKSRRDPFGPWLNGFGFEQAFDGNVWTLRKGEDFDAAPSTIAAKLREEFERRVGRLDVRVEGDAVHVKCTMPERV
jgi:hypothetical protein